MLEPFIHAVAYHRAIIICWHHPTRVYDIIRKIWHYNLTSHSYQQCRYQSMRKSNNILRPRQDGRRFPDDTFERIFLKENVIILIKISLKFVPNGPINNIPALVQIMAWCRPGDKPLSEPMTVRLTTHICVTRPQWDKWRQVTSK